jgi:hypothetical protein
MITRRSFAAAIDALGPKAASIRDQVAALPKNDPNAPERVRTEYSTSLITSITSA